jgi:hypothetical protein
MKKSDFAVVIIIDVLSYVPMYFHAYFNVRNINFKLYLEEILKGYKIKHHHVEATIFLFYNSRWLCRTNSSNLDSSVNATHSSVFIHDDEHKKENSDSLIRSQDMNYQTNFKLIRREQLKKQLRRNETN